MKRNQAIPSSWLVGLGAAAMALLYFRQRRKGKEWDCYARMFNQQRAAYIGSGVPRAAAERMADQVARQQCGMGARA